MARACSADRLSRKHHLHLSSSSRASGNEVGATALPRVSSWGGAPSCETELTQPLTQIRPPGVGRNQVFVKLSPFVPKLQTITSQVAIEKLANSETFWRRTPQGTTQHRI